jgi:hypothetical protein
MSNRSDKQARPLQEPYLEQLYLDPASVTLYMINGIKLRGPRHCLRQSHRGAVRWSDQAARAQAWDRDHLACAGGGEGIGGDQSSTSGIDSQELSR